MSKRPLGLHLAIATCALALVTGCTVPFFPGSGPASEAPAGAPGAPAGPAKGAFQKSSVTVRPLYVAGDSGGFGEQVVEAKPAPGESTMVDFSEDEVGGFGEMLRGAGWNAVTVATLLTGAPLDTQYRFANKGRVDGPSAGALSTVAVLSLYFGDDLDPKVTMTGTINPSGTIGPVGGIPEKVRGAIESKEFTKILIPLGSRNSPNSKRQLVDVVRLGSDNGVEVVEVGDIYAAYREFTGKTLPAPSDPGKPKVDSVGYDKLSSATTATLAKYQRSLADFAVLNKQLQEAAGDLVREADSLSKRAEDLQRQGLMGGAFVEASRATMMMEATTRTFSTIQNMLTGGIPALEASIAGAKSTEADFVAFVDKLGTYKPNSVADAEALVTAYGNAFDSFSLLREADARLGNFVDAYKAGSYKDLGAFLEDALMPLLYFQIAQSQLDYAKQLFDVGRESAGAPLADAVPLKDIGNFFRKGADANWHALQAGVFANMAKARGISTELMVYRIASIDMELALALSAQTSLPAIQGYIGPDKPNSAYAAMGYGYLNYARNAMLIEKYYSNGVLDDKLNVTGVKSEAALSSGLDLGKLQVERAASILAKHDTVSVLSIGAYEQAGLDREGKAADKFAALAQYQSSFMLSRIMAFIGGFHREGYER